jgi:hypothetical protein
MWRHVFNVPNALHVFNVPNALHVFNVPNALHVENVPPHLFASLMPYLDISEWRVSAPPGTDPGRSASSVVVIAR